MHNMVPKKSSCVEGGLSWS